MKKIILGLGLLFIFSCDFDDQFDELKRDLSTLNERIDALKEELGAIREVVVKLNEIDNELAQLTQAINALEENSDLGNLIAGLNALKAQVDILQNSVGANNTALVAQIQDLQKALELAIANDDAEAEEIAAQLAVLEEQLKSQSNQMATDDQMQDLLTEIAQVQNQLNALLEQNAFYNGNVVIKSAEDLAFYTEKLQGKPLKFINGYLEVEALGSIQGLSIESPEILSDFLKTIQVVTRSVYINTHVEELDLSSLTNVGGIYILRGADILDDALTVTGGMVLDYEGDFIYPNLRQVNTVTEYNYNLDGIVGLILSGPEGFGLGSELFNYFGGFIRLSNYFSAGDFTQTKTVDFSGLQVPVRIISETLDELTNNNNRFSIDGGLNLPEALSINLGLGTTGYVYAPKAAYVELGVENNKTNDFIFGDYDFYFRIPVNSDDEYFPGDKNNTKPTYPTYTDEELTFVYTKYDYSAFIVASATGSEVVLNGFEAGSSIFVLGAKVSAPDLESIGGNSLLFAPTIVLPSLNTIGNGGTLYLKRKSLIEAININNITDKDAIEGPSLLSNGDVRYEDILG
jgi:hypothetical protein